MSLVRDFKDFLYNFRLPVDPNGPAPEVLVAEVIDMLDAMCAVRVVGYPELLKRRLEIEECFYLWRRLNMKRLALTDKRFKHSEIMTWVDHLEKVDYYLPPEFRQFGPAE